VAATCAYLTVALAFQPMVRRLPRSGTAVSLLRVSYPDGQGMLRKVLQLATEQGFAVDELATSSREDGHVLTAADGQHLVEVMLHLHGKGSVYDLAARLSELPRVRAVASDDANVPIDD
jgi:putative Mg2+ transporter-C (MgtC) family protein